MSFTLQFLFATLIYAGGGVSEQSGLSEFYAMARDLPAVGSLKIVPQDSVAMLLRDLAGSLSARDETPLHAEELDVLNQIIRELKRKKLIKPLQSEFPVHSLSPNAWVEAIRAEESLVATQGYDLSHLSPDSINQVLDYVSNPKDVMGSQRVSKEWYVALNNWAYPSGMDEVGMVGKEQGLGSVRAPRALFQDHYYVAKGLCVKNHLTDAVLMDYIDRLTPLSLPYQLVKGLIQRRRDSQEFNRAFLSYSVLARKGNPYARETLLWLNWPDPSIVLPNEKWVQETLLPLGSKKLHPFYPRARYAFYKTDFNDLLCSFPSLEEKENAYELRAMKSGYFNRTRQKRFLKSLSNPADVEAWVREWHRLAQTREDRTYWLLKKAKLQVRSGNSAEAIGSLEKARLSRSYSNRCIDEELLKYYFVFRPEQVQALVSSGKIEVDFRETDSDDSDSDEDLFEGKNKSLKNAMLRQVRTSEDDFFIAHFLAGLEKQAEAIELYELHKRDLVNDPISYSRYILLLFENLEEAKAHKELDAFLRKYPDFLGRDAHFSSSLIEALATLKNVEKNESVRKEIVKVGSVAIGPGSHDADMMRIANSYFKAGLFDEAAELCGQCGSGKWWPEHLKAWVKICLDRNEPDKALPSLLENRPYRWVERDLEVALLELEVLNRLGWTSDVKERVGGLFNGLKELAILYLEEGEEQPGSDLIGKMESVSSVVEGGEVKDGMNREILCLRDHYALIKSDRRVRRNLIQCSLTNEGLSVTHAVSFQKEGLAYQASSILMEEEKESFEP